MRPQTTIQKILFPVDFSASSVAMAPFVKREAFIMSAKVTLLHVLDMSVPGFEPLVRPMPEIEENRQLVAREKLNSFLPSEFPIQQIPRLLLTGDPATRIVEAAREHGFDLIVMPTHAGTFRRMLLGSTTAKVLDDADCPVLTTEHAETISPRQLEHREWLCAIGLSADSERVLRYASQVTQAAHANLTLLHVIPASKVGSRIQLHLQERLESTEKKEANRRIEQLQRAAGSNARVTVAIGPMKDTLIETARRFDADVLVIGRSPQGGTLGRLRDLSYAVVRDAPCPVLSV
jgi:nucleotide-binding universal stress UspA family protein